MNMLIFILMNSIVIASSYLLTYKIIKIKNFIDSLLCLFILYLSQIVISEVILGILGALYLKNLILFNSVVLIMIYFVTKNIASTSRGINIFANLQGIVQNKIILFCVCAIGAFGLVKIFINLVNPPFGWDSLNYHFTFPVEWLKHGNLNIPITIFDDPSPSYYPINGSLFFLWLILPFKNVFLADLGQAPFFIIAALSVYGIARKIRLDKSLSFYSAALFLLIPNFFKQLQIAYVDVMVAGLFLACLNLLFLLNEDFSWKAVLIYSLSLGLLLGTKTVALPYSVLLMIPFFYFLVKNLTKWKLLFFSVFIVVIFGGYSYIKNFLDTGNFLYPLNFSFLGKIVLRGVMDSSVYRAHFNIHDYDFSKALFHEGLGLQTMIFVVTGAFLSLAVTVIRKRKEKLSFITAYIMALPILLYLVYRYIIPLANLRYLYCLLGIGMVLGLYLLKNLKIPKSVINFLVVICVFSSMGELAKRQELITAILLTVLFFGLGLSLRKKPDFGYLFIRKFASFFFIFLFIFLVFAEKLYVKNEFPGYQKMVKYSGFWPDAAKAWDWLNSNTAGNNIAYVGRAVAFPLYGSNFKNNVYYVSVNNVQPAKLNYFKHSNYKWGNNFESLLESIELDSNYRGKADFNIWLENLLKMDTDYLFVYSLQQTKRIIFPLEEIWAKSHAERFKLVFFNDTIHVYRLENHGFFR